MKFVKSLSMFHVDAKEIPCLTSAGAPTETTEGAVGVLYMDTDDGTLYKCTGAADGKYTWEPMGTGNGTGQNSQDGEDGGYYTPDVTQPTDDTMQVAFTPSKEGMPAVQPATVKLPVGSGSGSSPNLNLTVETIIVGDSGEPVDIPVTGLTLDLTSYNAKVGDGFYINPVVAPSNATNKAVTWKSSATNIATVDGNGYVECIGEGDATITCTTADGGFTATCAVSVAATSSGGEEGGGDDTGGETTGNKIQFSTLELTSGGIKADGTAHTLGGTYHVTIPYTEGMQIRTLWNTGWNTSTYPAFVVVTDGNYSAITSGYDILYKEDGTTKYTFGIGGKMPHGLETTLAGYPAGSSIIVNMLIGNAYGDDTYNGVSMDDTDYLYYIPGGGET